MKRVKCTFIKGIQMLRSKIRIEDYNRHVSNCRGKRDRNGDLVEMRMSYHEWSAVWIASGHAKDRGRGVGKYCMSRIDDIGHYEVDNVFIQSHSGNTRDSNFNQRGITRKPHSAERKAKISAACKGRVSPNKGKTLTDEHRSALSDAMLGNQNAKKHAGV